jgi:hypothetical protein
MGRLAVKALPRFDPLAIRSFDCFVFAWTVSLSQFPTFALFSI